MLVCKPDMNAGLVIDTEDGVRDLPMIAEEIASMTEHINVVIIGETVFIKSNSIKLHSIKVQNGLDAIWIT